MTDPHVSLDDAQLSVEPGGQARMTVTVKNLGTIVEGYELEVHGEGVEQWWTVEPTEIQVYPEQIGTATVILAPPTGTRNGTYPFALRTVSVVNGDSSAVTEGDLKVGRVDGLQAKLTPMTSSGRWRGKHSIELTNWGNSPVQLHLTASDPDQRLAFLLGPDIIDLPLAATGHAQLKVKTNKPFLRGSQVRIPFQVVADPDPPEVPAEPQSPVSNSRRAVLEGAFNQKPILSKLVITVGLISVLTLAGAIAWAVTRDPEPVSSQLTTGVPQTPELTALPADATSVQLLWKSQANIQSYRIYLLTADRKTSNVISVDGALEAHAIPDLTPDTEYCFKMEAIRDNQPSPPSDIQCARTPVATAPTSAASSVAASAETTTEPSSTDSPTEASLSATSDADLAEGTQPEPSSGASDGANSATVTGLATGQADQTPSEPSTAVSSPSVPTTLSPTAEQSPQRAGTFTAQQYIGVLATYLLADDPALPRAEAKQQALRAAGIPALILRTRDYPDLRLVTAAQPADAYLIYVGPFDTQEEAEQYCASQPVCQVVQPNPSGLPR